jgi:peptidoglycan hydrolase-like protein with peptidoglycan-binding domain
MRRRKYRRLASVVFVASLVSGITASGVFAYSRLDVAEAAGTSSDDPSATDPGSDSDPESESDPEAPSEPAPDEGEAPSDSSETTAQATTVDLIDEDEVGGQLGYGEATELNGQGGVITRVPEEGELLERGDAAWDVDGQPGPAVIFGGLPQWRRIDSSAEDGADILQLEYNLVMLGFDAGTVDEEFDSDTREAIKDWQESRGLDRTGVIEIGDLVVVPDPVRVDEIKLPVGAEATGAVLGVTDVDQVVTLNAEIDQLDLFEVGDGVLVELPDDRRVGGTVTEIAKTATADQDGAVTVEVLIALDEPEPSLVAAPVTVIVQKTRVDDAVVVPIRALLALAEGGYAVEKVSGGSTTLVPVELGEFGDGVVQVTSDSIVDGDTVVVAP